MNEQRIIFFIYLYNLFNFFTLDLFIFCKKIQALNIKRKKIKKMTNFFHLLFDWLFTLGSIASIIYGIFGGGVLFLLSGIVTFLLYPIILEIWLLLFAKCTFDEKKEELIHKGKSLKMADSCGIVYHKSYNITACGLENMHPFDSVKYGR